MVQTMQDLKEEKKKGAWCANYNKLSCKSEKALKQCNQDVFHVELETERQAANLWIQVQLAKIRYGFKPKKFTGDGYYVLKNFVPASMQLLLLCEAEGFLEKSNEEPTHILSCQKAGHHAVSALWPAV